jgi:hypothetical protein
MVMPQYLAHMLIGQRASPFGATAAAAMLLAVQCCLFPLAEICGNLFLTVRLLVWADGRGTVARADSAARAELQGAPKQK